MSLTVSVLATGSELLDGRVLDTNSNFVARELAARGMRLVRVLCVDDLLDELLAGLDELSKVSHLIITSGGLGPTSDDLTREAVSTFAGVGLSESSEARAHVESFFAKRGRVADAANLKQALLPDGSSMIPNLQGSAPGFLVQTSKRAAIAALSGVPREFKAMFAETVLPYLLSRAVNLPSVARAAFMTFGLPESKVGEIVHGLAINSDVKVSYRAAFPEVQVVLSTDGGVEKLDESARLVRRALGDFVFSERENTPLELALHELLLGRKLTVSVAESCTGGLLGELFTSQAGSSAYFEGGVIAYQNRVKARELNVSEELLLRHGAVSREVAEAMAHGVRARLQTAFSIAVTGVAGPDGGSDEKPVGTVYITIASDSAVTTRRCFFPNDRSNVRRYAAAE